MTKATPTITWSNPNNITYGTKLTNNQLDATANVAGTFVYTPAAGTVLNAGNNQALTVIFTPKDTTHYSSTTMSVVINVLKATLTVATADKTKTYGNAFTAFTGSVSGLKNGDNITIGSFSSAGTAATATVAGGPYAICATLNDPSGKLANYTVVTNYGSLVVNRATLTITANNATKTYGQTLTFGGTAFTLSGLKNSDAVTSVTLSSTGSGATATVAGSPYDITATAAVGTGLTNYTITYKVGHLTINKAALVITAHNMSKTFGQTVTFDGTEFTANGLVNGDAVTTVKLASVGAAATAKVANSPYSITASAAEGTGLGNYAITYVSGTLTVNQATPTLTVTDAGGTYTGHAFPATVTIAGVNGVAGASLEGVKPTLVYFAGTTATGTPLAGAPTGRGTYTVMAVFAGSADYASVSVETTFKIDP